MSVGCQGDAAPAGKVSKIFQFHFPLFGKSSTFAGNKPLMKKLVMAVVALLSVLPLAAQNKSHGKKSDHSFIVGKNLDVFNTIYRDLDLMYVDTLDADKVVRVGIDAMLEYLDPYTEYYAEEDMGDLKMMTTGKYGGIGAIIRMRKDSTVIIGEPYADMPAAEVGLRVGDVLKRIDDTDLKGKNVNEVSDLLRGEPGTTFVLRVLRPGEQKERDFHITRRNVKVPAIPYYGMVSPTVGYIGLTQFTEDCSVELRKAVISLKEQGARGLVLDLRGNGGGLLSEAVNIVNLFVPKGLTIVETKGKLKAVNTTYTTKSDPLDLETPLCVLVNSSTASAAEIVSGSLQDLDRAVILGTRTYGKGLVQSPRELPYDGSLKLTTSKYYIPSGRCIQAIDYQRAREMGNDGRVPDSLARAFRTAGGRTVLDSGGIRPDIEVKHDTLSNLVVYLSSDDVLVDWGTRYQQTHATLPPVSRFSISDQDVADLLRMARDSGFKYDQLTEKRLEDLKKMARFEGYYEDAKPEFEALEQKLQHNLDSDFAKNDKDIRSLMTQEVVKRYYYQAGSVEAALQGDEDLRRAEEVLADSEAYRRLLTPVENESSTIEN